MVWQCVTGWGRVDVVAVCQRVEVSRWSDSVSGGGCE